MSYRTFSRVGKRALDICIGAAAFALLLPLMLLVACAIWIADGSPILFVQRRPGQGERLFALYKFRTMKAAASDDQAVVSDGSRLTPLGRVLRHLSLDELPQLWSVLSGDLSLVGPRPLLQRYLPYMSERERLRHTVPPGITGWAQLHGRNTVGWNDRLELDVWYVEHWSMTLDLRILLHTVPYVLRSTGVVADARVILQNLDEERQGARDSSLDR